MLHRVEVAADAGTVFKALTTSEGLAGFWTPGSHVEAEIGSVATFEFTGSPVDLKLRIDELDQNRRVTWTCIGDFPRWGETTITWDMSELPEGGTGVLFRHTGWGDDYPDDQYGSVNFTWGQVVAALKAYAETGQPKPALS